MFSSPRCSRIVPAALTTVKARGVRKSVRQQFRLGHESSLFPKKGCRRLRGSLSAFISIGLEFLPSEAIDLGPRVP
jgi:hypothetical protein